MFFKFFYINLELHRMQNRKQVNLERITQIEQKLNAISQARATNTKE